MALLTLSELYRMLTAAQAALNDEGLDAISRSAAEARVTSYEAEIALREEEGEGLR